MYGKITFVNDFFFLLVYITLNTISTLTCLLLICWFYIHRITCFFFFLWRSLVLVKCFMPTLDDLDMQNLIYHNIFCFFNNSRVCVLVLRFNVLSKEQLKKIIMTCQKCVVEGYLFFWIGHSLLIYYGTESSLMNEWN